MQSLGRRMLLAACAVALCATAYGVSTSERDALVDLFHATSGTDWDMRVDWLNFATAPDPCIPFPWTGVFCTATTPASIT